ncbi:hypothetical protein A3715_15615 [Oleiphilus sp. HI0009]|nr:hypothetical protein A3715_15615 [Oleiphilus sp. HI0009]
MNTLYSFHLNSGYSAMYVGQAIHLANSDLFSDFKHNVLMLDQLGDFSYCNDLDCFKPISFDSKLVSTHKQAYYLYTGLDNKGHDQYKQVLSLIETLSLNDQYKLLVLVDDAHMYSSDFLQNLSNLKTDVFYFCHHKYASSLEHCNISHRFTLSPHLAQTT